MERRCAVALTGIDVDSLFEKGPGRFQVSRFHGFDQTEIRGCRHGHRERQAENRRYQAAGDGLRATDVQGSQSSQDSIVESSRAVSDAIQMDAELVEQRQVKIRERRLLRIAQMTPTFELRRATTGQ